MKKIFIFALIILIAGFAYLKFHNEDGWLCVDGSWVKHGNPSAEMPKSGCGPITPIVPPITPPVVPPIVTPIVPPIVDGNSDSNIVVSEPKSNDIVTSPFKVTGKARVFENQFNYRLKGSDGSILAQGNPTANAPDVGQFGPFEFQVTFPPNSVSGTLEVFDSSPKDGSEIDMVTVPLTLKASDTAVTGDTMSVKVYFANSKMDPEVTCEKVFPVERVIPKTQSTAKVAIEELLKGPTADEKTAQYTTQLNDGVVLNKLTIVDGVAKVDFSAKMDEKMGGSCRVGLIRRQIEETLKQFPSIKSVVISVEGRTEDILQP
jgi:hypothetical protein